MIYGTASVQNELIDTAIDFAKNNNLLLIYGATIGSISKGINFPNSDYDARFLYLEKNNLGKIYIPWSTPEEKLHFKYRSENGRLKNNKVLDDCLPFWEATSFFQFLKRPSYNQQISLGLYNTFAWTLLSPYSYDPYGLQMKLLPLINTVYNANWQFEWYKSILNKYELLEEMELSWKDYLNALHAALAMAYIKDKKEFAPIYLPELAYSFSNDLGDKCVKLIDTAYAKFSNNAMRCKEIDSFIESARNFTLPDLEFSEESVDITLKKVYALIFSSIEVYKRDAIQMSGGRVK